MSVQESAPKAVTPKLRYETVTYDRQFGWIGRVPLTLLLGAPAIAITGGIEYATEGTAWPVIMVGGGALALTTPLSGTLNDPVSIRVKLPNVPDPSPLPADHGPELPANQLPTLPQVTEGLE
ncbi:MAG TPA: hypothetical protein VJR27_02665 [Candidatus Saccharimonadales bacterium]|nr:hypothetical protein [Candidatus Saccharimonadales bacterium]